MDLRRGYGNFLEDPFEIVKATIISGDGGLGGGLGDGDHRIAVSG